MIVKKLLKIQTAHLPSLNNHFKNNVCIVKDSSKSETSYTVKYKSLDIRGKTYILRADCHIRPR